jgi:nitroreductase
MPARNRAYGVTVRATLRAMPTLPLDPDTLLTTTRAVRKRLDFDRPVERELIEECLQIALQAPSGSNSQPWHWRVVTDPDLKSGIAEHYRRSWAAYAGSGRSGGGNERIAASAAYLAERFHEVPAMVIICMRGRVDTEPAATQASRYGSVMQAGWSFQLAARVRSLGTCFTTLHLVYEREVADLLGIPYEQYQQAGLITVGHTIGDEFRPAERRPLERVLHWDRW